MGYRIYEKKNGSWKQLTNVKNNAVYIKELKMGTKYTFAIRAYSIENKKVRWSPTYTTFNITTAKK